MPGIADKVTVEVKDGILTITAPEDVRRAMRKYAQSQKHRVPVEYKISMPVVHQLLVNGSGKIKTLTDLQSDGDLTLTLNGSGDIILHSLSYSGRYIVTLNGSGDIAGSKFVGLEGIFTLNGSGDIVINALQMERLANTTLNGSGDFLVGAAQSGGYSCALHGSGDMKLKNITTQALKASIAGSGDLELGHAKGVDISTSLHGSGDFKAEQLDIQEKCDIACVGSGDMRIGKIQSPKTSSVHLQGSGELTIGSFRGEALKAKQHGSGDMTIKHGTAERFDIAIGTSGNLDTHGLECQEVYVNAKGSAEIEVYAQRKLVVEKLGSQCELKYGGDAKVILQGKVKRSRIRKR